MDPLRIVEALRATLDQNHQKEAESLLKEVYKIIGFTPMLLQIVMTEDMAIPVRQAGVIYLKNTIISNWMEKEPEKPGDPIPYSIHEQDRQHVRERIVEAIIAAPLPIRVQLKRVLEHMIKSDFPGRWHDFPQKLMAYLSSDDQSHLFGSLICVHSLVKVYEYKKADERDPLLMVMQTMLPLLKGRLAQFITDESMGSVNIQKIILKIFHTLTQVFLPLSIITKEEFEQWMEHFHRIIERDVPQETMTTPEDERGDLIWWKCKKWVMHVLTRVFSRYGSPGHVGKTYTEFAQWYLKRFPPSIIPVLLNICNQFRCGVFVAPRVLQQTLNYFSTAVTNGFSWNLLKIHFPLLVEEVIFPLLCHSEADQELWESDQQEYIRTKADILEDLISPASAAWSLLKEACTKRKNVLAKTMGFATHVLMTVRNNEDNTRPADASTPATSLSAARQKDGALHIIGSLAELLSRKKAYEEQMEPFIINYVYPVFSSQHGFLRARVCWVLAQLVEVKVTNQTVMRQSMEYARLALEDGDLPVRYAAASCIKAMLADSRLPAVSDIYKGLMRPHLESLFKVLVTLIQETETDDMNTVLQDIVYVYEEEISPIAFDITQNLANLFRTLIQNPSNGMDGDRDEEERSFLAMGILHTLDAILTACEDQKEVMARLETLVVPIVGAVLHDKINMYYDDVLSLASSLTSAQVSPMMWQVYDLIFTLFTEEDGMDYFQEGMPALHNYVTLDKDAFLLEPRRLEMALSICSKALGGSDPGEDAECNAAKLLEIILLDYRGRIDQFVPAIVGMALQRLVRPVLTSELRTMCLQVGIAGLYYDHSAILSVLAQTPIPDAGTTVLEIFVKQWLSDVDCFLGIHDRKMCVLGLCILLALPAGQRPDIVSKSAAEIMPSMISLFSGLKRAYGIKAATNANCDEDSDDEEDDENEELDSDEDEIDEEDCQYQDKLEKMHNGDDDSDSDDDDFEDGETQLEYYTSTLDDEDSPVDEYNIFRSTLQELSDRDPTWYQSVTSHMNQEQWDSVKDVIKIAEQRQQQRESKRIEEAGGYSFNQTAVPSNFNFGGSFPHS